MTKIQRTKDDIPPIEFKILAKPEVPESIIAADAFPMDPTTATSRSDSPSKVSWIPSPMLFMIVDEPLAKEEIVLPKILPTPVMIDPPPTVL